MGSGLILLVIVGAWLAVLVPMALRSHDAATGLRSADRFGDAMRVLSRRSRGSFLGASPQDAPLDELDEGEGLPDVEPLTWASRSREAAGRAGWAVTAVVGTQVSAARDRVADALGEHRALRSERPPLSAAARRRRVLGTLVGLTAVGFAGSGASAALLALGVVGLLLTVAYLVVLRLCVLRAAQHEMSSAAHGAGFEDRWEGGWYEGDAEDDGPWGGGSWDEHGRWTEPADVEQEPAVRTAVRDEDPLPLAVGEQARTWTPAPVPPPTYLSAPPARPRPQRTIDLTRVEQEAASWVPPHARSVEAGQDAVHDDALERRRAVGGW